MTVRQSENWSEESTGLCPECLRTVPARLYAEAGRVWIRQSCARHGESRALLSSDADEYLRLRQYVPDRTGAGCCCGPDDICGPSDGAHVGPPVCILLLEITQACNLRCPTCYADARGHDFMTPEEARRRLDAFFREQSRLDVLMLSGGEPTIHPRFAEVLDLALSYPINRVLVNTNGLRLWQKDELVALLARHRDRVELYFSFGSFRPDVHRRLYGRDLTCEKRGALERARDAGIFTTLVPTVETGVNEDEIGDLYRFALSLDNINGVTYQPVMDNGRYENAFDPARRLTLTGVIAELERQTGGALTPRDFVGLPCSHPDCCALTYGLLDADRTTLTPLPRHLDVARYMDLFSDRITFQGILGGAARRVWSDVANLRAGQTLRDLAVLFARGGLRDALPLLNRSEEMGKRIFRVVVKPFMDAHTYDHNRIKDCCTKIVNERGEAVSFCEYNVFHRGRKPKAGAVPLMMAR
jgi:Predicted Fe-S oxidoreductases